MDLNTIAVGVLGILLTYGVYYAWKSSQPVVHKTLVTPWGEQVGRTRPIQSKTGDASMATERTRRKTIFTSNRMYPEKVRESRTATGSVTGAVETFFLSGMCPPVLIDLILQGDGVTDENCLILEGNSDGTVYDAGGVNTTVCNI
jgi:hypothetical protein